MVKEKEAVEPLFGEIETIHSKCNSEFVCLFLVRPSRHFECMLTGVQKRT